MLFYLRRFDVGAMSFMEPHLYWLEIFPISHGSMGNSMGGMVSSIYVRIMEHGREFREEGEGFISFCEFLRGRKLYSKWGGPFSSLLSDESSLSSIIIRVSCMLNGIMCEMLPVRERERLEFSLLKMCRYHERISRMLLEYVGYEMAMEEMYLSPWDVFISNMYYPYTGEKFEEMLHKCAMEKSGHFSP